VIKIVNFPVSKIVVYSPCLHGPLNISSQYRQRIIQQHVTESSLRSH